jgi:hypothetical protein
MKDFVNGFKKSYQINDTAKNKKVEVLKMFKNEMTVYEMLEKVVSGISSNVNKKALKEIVKNNYSDMFDNDYNYILKAYYDRVHRMTYKNTFTEFITIDDFENENDFKQYIKDNYNIKWYKKQYNYNMHALEPIKQKNTGFIIAFNNGFMSRGSYLFNVNKFINVNNIVIKGGL